MHLYGLLQRIFPDRIAGVVFALIYVLTLVLVLMLASVEPAAFNYGRY